MKLEVTEKEAQDIIANRLIRKKGKGYFIFGIISLLVGVVAFYLIPNSWLGLLVFCIIIAPAMFTWSKLTREAKKYAWKIIDEKGKTI